MSATRSIFKSLKAELIWRRDWRTRREVEMALVEYLNGFYNLRRKHSALCTRFRFSDDGAAPELSDVRSLVFWK